jgi:syndecan 4
VTENTATISWDPVQANIDRYMVSYTSADGETREIPVRKEKSSTVLTGLRPGVEYTVHVWAQKGSRESKKADTKAPTGNEHYSLGINTCHAKSMRNQVLFSFSYIGRL